MKPQKRYLVTFAVEFTMPRYGYGENAEEAFKLAKENLEQSLNQFMLLNPDFCLNYNIRENPLYTVDEGVVHD